MTRAAVASLRVNASVGLSVRAQALAAIVRSTEERGPSCPPVAAVQRRESIDMEPAGGTSFLSRMAQTIYTKTLARAAEIHGSTQSLASFLRVPENTLLRWMSGRAQMPLQAFLKLIETIAQHEHAGSSAVRGEKIDGQPLTFKMGQLLARCRRCDGAEFALADPEAELKLTSRLACRACGEHVVHGNLISELAKDAVQQSRTVTVSRQKRQADLLKGSPKLRGPRQAAAPQIAPQREDPDT